ncbi:MAG: CHASE4 domain-containing protein, partial [Candidatus Margulisiibacteriota bacterium]
MGGGIKDKGGQAMSFRLKIIVSLFVVLVFFFFVSDFMTRVVIFNTFKQIEQNFGIGEIGRITYFIQDAFKQFDYTVRDWARWDDTYQFVEKPSQKYIFANLTNESFKNVNVDLMIFLNKEGKVVFSKWYDKTLNKLVDLPQDALNKVVSDFKKRDTVGLKGLDIINHIPVLVISQPILRTDGSGPSRGTLIMARSFDIDQVKRMTALTHLYADYFVLNNKLPKEIIEILPKLRDKLIDLKA